MREYHQHHHHYTLDVCLSPTAGVVSVTAAIDWRLPAAYAGEEILLALHKSARVQRFSCSLGPGTRYELREGSPLLYAAEAATLAVIPAASAASMAPAAPVAPVPPAGEAGRQVSPVDAVHFEIAYELRPGIILPWEVNLVTPQWVELGLYAPWFPMDPAYGSFTYEAAVRTEPGYVVTSNAEVTRTGDDTWHLRGNRPDKDCILIASRQLREETGRLLSVLYAADEHAGYARRVLEDGDWLLGRFRKVFGTPEVDGAEGGGPIRLVIAPRTKGGGYARRGFVVLTPGGLEDPLRAFRWIAHELAHLWWYRADVTTWEDWLNESFAEYSAVMAVRERFGDAAAEELLTKKRERMPGLPAVRGLPREHEQAQEVLYGKGCLLLHELAEAVGRELFGRLQRRMNRAGVASTEEFLTELAEVAGPEVASQFGDRLVKGSGGARAPGGAARGEAGGR